MNTRLATLHAHTHTHTCRAQALKDLRLGSSDTVEEEANVSSHQSLQSEEHVRERTEGQLGGSRARKQGGNS